jgi:hypothetical protein
MLHTDRSQQFPAKKMAVLVLSVVLMVTSPMFPAAPVHAATDYGVGFDVKGETPKLGTVAEGRFLRLCEVTGCISSGDEVGSSSYVAPWTYNNDGKALSNGGDLAARQAAMSDLLTAFADEKVGRAQT